MKKLIAIGAGLITTSALAAVTNGTALSQAKVKSSFWKDFAERSSISYFGEFSDPNINTKQGSTINDSYYYQSISGRYRINDTWTARADVRFQSTEGVTDKYTEFNPRLGLQGVTYSKGNFSIFTLLRLELAAVSSSTDVDKLIRPLLYNAASYSTGSHSFSLGAQIAKWFYEDFEQSQSIDSRISAMDSVADFTYRYSFNDDIAFQSYSAWVFTSRWSKDLGDLVELTEYHNIGADFLVAKNVMDIMTNVTVFPHIVYYPDNDREFRDLGFGAWISAGFFR